MHNTHSQTHQAAHQYGGRPPLHTQFCRPVRSRRRVQSFSHAHDVPTITNPLPIPPQLFKDIQTANRQWVREALNHPLAEGDLDARIVLLGVTHYAPGQQEAVQAVLQQVQPEAVALALPQSMGQQDVLLPYPQVLQLLLDLRGTGLSTSSGSSQVSQPLTPTQSLLLSDMESPDLRPDLRLGRDILDPYEVLGYYQGIDYTLRPQQSAAAVRLFGWLPGQECAEALQWTLDHGAELHLLDASPRIQEAWVAGLLRDWELREADLGRQLGVELAAVQELVPGYHSEWDQALAQSVAAEAAAAGGAKPSKEVAARMITAFKVSRACAAAVLPPGETTELAVERQAKLQPLKYALFEKQALHVATQLKELCRSRATGTSFKKRVVVPSEMFSPPPAAHADTSSSASSTADGLSAQQPQQTTAQQPPPPATGRPSAHQPSAASQQPAFTVVAVVGRQYVHMIRRLWSDPHSALWRGDVPRTFAPSVLLDVRVGQDPDTDSGGSRPVGQRPLNAPK